MTKKTKYIIDTKNSAGVMLVDDGNKDVTINTCDADGCRNGLVFFSHKSLRILSAELLIAAAKLEAGTLFEEEFDWDTVKAGMAFNYEDKPVWYVAADFEEASQVVIAKSSSCETFRSVKKSDLTRAPEHDIKKG
jgi:hypothetical protein